ncbi:MAG: hypothetical protein WBP45_13070, partial [Daejeonella sp.]
SNYYFNEAEKYMEQVRSGVGDIAIGTLVNPMMQKYKGEDFEKFMIHYYKTLNYLHLKKTEDALVEARRITLQTQQQGDKFNEKNSRYSKDAFSLMLQGIIYEAGNDINNAFIAYRNAVEVYQNSPNGTYYGVSIPEQLKKDVIRTAYLNGFQGEFERFQKMFNTTYQPERTSKGGELIIFWENGLAPIKEEENLFFSLLKDQNGYYFTDPGGQNKIPFNGGGLGFETNTIKLQDLETFRIAFPKYVARPLFYTSASISLNNTTIQLEKSEDINELAFETLRQRFAKEIATALSRLAVKKIIQYGVEGKSYDSKKKKNKEVRGGLATAIQLYSLFSEQADTRNWQSLPSTIYYGRIPLQRGSNEIKLSITDKSGKEDIKTIKIEGNGELIFYNYSSSR